MLGSPNATHQRPECICSTAEHPTLATENVSSNFRWKKDHYKLCLLCHQTWATYITPSVQPHVIRWQNRHPMETLEQFRQYCLEYAARHLFRRTEIMCVCSTPASEIVGTRTRSNFPCKRRVSQAMRRLRSCLGHHYEGTPPRQQRCREQPQVRQKAPDERCRKIHRVHHGEET